MTRVMAPRDRTYQEVARSSASTKRPSRAAPASEKQVEFLTTLLGQRELSDPQRATVVDGIASGELTKSQASGYIDYLLRQPRKPAAPETDNPVTVEGLYERDGQVYRVRRSKTSGNLYATVYTGGSPRWEYAPGMLPKLDATKRMTAERADELSLSIGHCLICGRELRVKESVQRGIGPVCAGRV